MVLERTGERVVTDGYMSSIQDYVIYLMHMASYDWAASFIEGKRVLDFGCGSGFGSHMMSKTAKSVEAVDVAAEAIEYASRRYSASNVRFGKISPTGPIPFADRSFDVVTSFQVLEHVADQERYLREAFRVLMPGGKLLLITPNRTYRLLPGQRPWNRWHLMEFSEAQLKNLVTSVFPEVEMLRMSGRKDVIDVDIRRARLMKWLLLPFTIPMYPDALRVWLLSMLHAGRSGATKKAARKEFGFDHSTIQIGPGLNPCLNLVAIARRGVFQSGQHNS